MVILGDIGDNFAAGMTGGMAFIYDPDKKFENFVNPQSVVWQKVETNFWKDYLKDLIEEFDKETNSIISRKILLNFEEDLKNFVQVCPIEMLDKLDNPISLKEIKIKSA